MMKFWNPELPDQVYRLWTSLFLHAGIVPYLLTQSIHLIYMSNLEKMSGTVRVAIIYIGSGICGNLASAIFVPHRATVGPNGCLAGIMSTLFVLFFVDYSSDLRASKRITVELALFLTVCFLFGLFPGVDNYANIFGFGMGTLLSIALLPHVGHLKSVRAAMANPQPCYGVTLRYQNVVTPRDQMLSSQRRLITFVVSMSVAVVLLIVLLLVLYLWPFQCDWCSYLDCFPFTDDFCAELESSFKWHKIIT